MEDARKMQKQQKNARAQRSSVVVRSSRGKKDSELVWQQQQLW